MVLERLDCPFHCVDAVVRWLDELPSAFFLLEEGFDWLDALIISDVERWLVPFAFRLLKTPSNDSMMVSSFKSLIGVAKI